MFASSNDTSSWLRAPPIPSLSLSMPPNEFPLAVKILVKNSFIPFYSFYVHVAHAVIDPNGDTSLVVVTALSGSDGMMLYVISSMKPFCLTINQ